MPITARYVRRPRKKGLLLYIWRTDLRAKGCAIEVSITKRNVEYKAMKKNTVGVFPTRNDAEKFINFVHQKFGIPHDEISFVYRNTEEQIKEVDTSEVSSKTAGEGAKKGAKVGAVVGSIGTIAAVAGVIPVIGPLFAAGPILVALGISGAVSSVISGAAVGAAAGGLIGALANLGMGEENAQEYQDMVMAGRVLVAVHSERDDEVRRAMLDHKATLVQTYRIAV